MEFKEITAKTVDEAITKACLEFETSSDNLEIQVVQEGTSGFLGFIGSKPAVIKVRKKVQEEEFDILKELAKEEKKEKSSYRGSDQNRKYGYRENHISACQPHSQRNGTDCCLHGGLRHIGKHAKQLLFFV